MLYAYYLLHPYCCVCVCHNSCFATPATPAETDSYCETHSAFVNSVTNLVTPSKTVITSTTPTSLHVTSKTVITSTTPTSLNVTPKTPVITPTTKTSTCASKAHVPAIHTVNLSLTPTSSNLISSSPATTHQQRVVPSTFVQPRKLSNYDISARIRNSAYKLKSFSLNGVHTLYQPRFEDSTVPGKPLYCPVCSSAIGNNHKAIATHLESLGHLGAVNKTVC